MSKWDRDCADAVKWLRQNQRRFQREIIEPPVISLSVPDQRYAAAVEASFNSTQLRVSSYVKPTIAAPLMYDLQTFVAQSREDYVLFNRLLTDTGDGVGRKLRLTTWFRPLRREELMPPPMSEEEVTILIPI